ncbi:MULTISPECIES: AfsR/SARP family transcriptional regulator [Catenuloplanes]|uniref:DNA-binding SARP family transcriptional activator n=1 Tax=Catenuloplanes niger TaxID=587534 RepID=A0AAE3ZKV0_9ACTN|nr:BTAD domain-containing putative transcriptional regulator [Catenuloplanes niger]MDR7321799.1 DNA-binding SARP family transcriptional activator [Catenuloplanes niger]
MALRFTLLGPATVRREDRLLPVPSGRPSALLAALLLGRGRMSADRLTEALWDEPPASAASNLRSYAAALRRLLGADGDRLHRTGDGYLLRVEDGELDLHDWERAVAAAQRATERGGPGEAADLLAGALDRWRGPAAEGVTRRGAVGRALDALDEARSAATERFARACVDAGRLDRAIACLRPFVAEHPTRETAWECLVEALSRGGDRAGALETFGAARAALAAELGIEPGPGLREWHTRLLRGEPVVASTGTGGVRTLPPDTELVGRAALLDEVVGAVTGGPPGCVVALHGPAGVGKSVLAVRAAWRLAADHPDGQLYLDMYGSTPGLTPLRTGDAVAGLLHALRVPTSGGEDAQLRTLSAELRDRRCVVLLDNVVDAAQVRRLLTGLTGATVIVTSRAVLSTLDVRRHVAVDVLTPASSAALLARLDGQRRVEAAPADADALAELCGHLPLALRIVGARLAGRADRSLADMVTRLTDERHRLDELAADDLAVRSALALTCGTLRDRPGGGRALDLFDAWGAVGAPLMGVDLARALTGADRWTARAALDLLAEVRLVEPAGDERYRLHDLVRIFAMERAAGRTADPVRRARRYFLATARRARDLLRPNVHRADDGVAETVPTVALADDRDAVHWFETERVNLRDAITRCARDGTPEGDAFAARLVVELYPFLPMRGYYTDWQELAEAALRCARRAGDARDEIGVLIQLAGARTRAARHREAIGALRSALEVAERLADGSLTALVLDHLAVALTHAGQLVEAKETFLRCVDLHRAGGHRSRLGITLNNLADCRRQLGEYDDALRHLSESLELRRALGDQIGVGVTTLSIGQVFAEHGRAGEALTWLTDARALTRDSGNREGEWRALTVRAGLLRAAGRPGDARADLVAALALSESVGDDTGADQVRMALAALSWTAEEPALR